MDDGKLVQIANAVDKAGKKHKSIKWFKKFHDFALIAVCLLVALTGGVYAFEKLNPTENYIRVIAMVSTVAEFESEYPIEWIPLAQMNTSLDSIEITTILRCDMGVGDGFEFISSTEQEFVPSELTSMEANRAIGAIYDRESGTFGAIARWLRDFAVANSITTFKYDGAIPTEISNCYGEHTFTAMTPVLGIPKTVSINSYPFDYVWYDNPEK